MNDVRLGKLILMIGAAVTFIFSFLPWMSYSGFGSSVNRSAWGSGMFPMATWAPVFAIIVGFLVAVETFKFLKIPEKIWEFTLDQVVLVLSVFAFLVTLSYLITDKGGASIGFGLILCFLGTIAMVGGYFMDKLGIGGSIGESLNSTNANQQSGFPPPGTTGFPAPGQAAPPAPGQAAPPAPGQAPASPPPGAQAPQSNPSPPQQQPGTF